MMNERRTLRGKQEADRRHGGTAARRHGRDRIEGEPEGRNMVNERRILRGKQEADRRHGGTAGAVSKANREAGT